MLAVILLIIKFASGFLQNMSVLIGITVGYLVTIGLGWTDFSGIQQEPWIRVVLPLQFGLPTFSLVPCMIMCLVMTIVFHRGDGNVSRSWSDDRPSDRTVGRDARASGRLARHA